MANIEAFRWNISLSANLLLMKSALRVGGVFLKQKLNNIEGSHTTMFFSIITDYFFSKC